MFGVLIFTTKAIFDVSSFLFLPLGIMFSGYLPLLIMYLKAIKFAKQEESRRRAPLLSFALSSIDGQETIRGLGLVEKFKESMKAYILFQSQSRAFAIASDAWFCLRIELLGNIATLLIGIGAIFFNVEPALAAFAINYSNSLSGLAMWTIRQWTLTAANMISYGRVLELTNLPPESRNDLYGHTLIGDINIYGISASFRADMTPVLRNLSLHIQAGKKIAIWGRTGSGKSSLLLSLLGFLTVVKGHIMFDGVDRDKIDLTTLRRQIGYCGQDAVCFHGSLRFNLDPFGHFSDDLLQELLDALGLALQLDDDVMACPKSVHETICFGRVILGRQRVVLLDEPLASVESSAVHRILHHPFVRSRLSGSTIILTSHRPELLGFCNFRYEMADGQIIYNQ
jgi:ABC-type multidrug transport system fused ATPase/permease subunit